jgi:SAM-dependent methyltransferase
MLTRFKKALRNGSLKILGYNLTWSFSRVLPVREFNLSFFERPYRIHLGPGPNWNKPTRNWIDVDIDPQRGDLQVDFQDFTGFPFEDSSVDSIYGSHVFEHMSIWVTDRVFDECYRVLAPNGVLRIIIPDVEKSINEYVNRNAQFSLFAKRKTRALEKYGKNYTLFDCLREDFLSKSSQLGLLGGNALAHQNAWDFEALANDLERAGFTRVERKKFQQSNSDNFSFEGTYASEANEFDRSLYVEAVK